MEKLNLYQKDRFMPIEMNDKKLYTLLEVSKLLEVTHLTIRNYIKKGKLKAQKIGKSFFISEDSLIEFLQAN